MLEYETAEMAEEAQQQADGLALGGSHLRVSFCAPGPPGRSMLAALIAAQATVSVCTAGGGGGGTGGQTLLPQEIRAPGGHQLDSGVNRERQGPPLWPGRALKCPLFLSSGPQSGQRPPA